MSPLTLVWRGDVSRFVRTLRFAPFLEFEPTMEIKRLRRRWEFEAEYRDVSAGDTDNFPQLVEFCSARQREQGRFLSALEREDLWQLLDWIEEGQNAWRGFLHACAPTLTRLELPDIGQVRDPRRGALAERISSEWFQAVLELARLPPFVALTSLHLTLGNDYHLHEYLEHYDVFPNLEELVVLFSGKASPGPHPSWLGSWPPPDHLEPSLPHLARIKFGRPADYSSKYDERSDVSLRRLGEVFKFVAPTVVQWIIDLNEVPDEPFERPHLCQLFPAPEYPRLEHLAVPNACPTSPGGDDEDDSSRLDKLFPALESVKVFSLAPQSDLAGTIPRMPKTLEHLDLLYPREGLHHLVRLVDSAPGLETLHLRSLDPAGDTDPVQEDDAARRVLADVRRALRKAHVECRGEFDVLDSDSDDPTFQPGSEEEDSGSSDDELAGEVVDSDEDERPVAERR